ncbi:TPA: HNH endonuclease [Serratia marcescens]|nr:HNH endonuclease [Serratia marcescens]
MKKNHAVTQEVLKGLLDYNSDSGLFTWKVSTGGRKKGDECKYIIPSTGYIAIRVAGKLITAHRLAWLYHYGELPDGEIDHIDRCRTNNAIRNLRVVSRSINSFNTKLRSDNSTGFKGVYYYKDRKKYWAFFWKDKKRVSLGYHDTAEQADLAVRLAKNLNGIDHI